MTRQEFYVKWGIAASFEMRDDLIAALSVELPTTLPGEQPGRAGRDAALLAVAKAADQADPTRALASMVTWSQALKALDAEYPGWREWTA